jgi:hypothetical protein
MVKTRDQITVVDVTDIDHVTRYYLAQASTLTAPSKPTANPPGGNWVTTEPTYSSGSTNSLYFTDLTVWSNGEYDYSAVSLSSSYEAAKAAYNKAVAAQSTADAAQTSADSINSDLQQTKTLIQQTADGIRQDVSSTYLTKDGYTADKASVLSQTNSAITASFNQSKSLIDALTGTVNTNQQTLETNIRIDSNGISIGKSTSKVKGVFTNDKLSFQEDGIEVAYIGDKKIYITDAEVTNSLKIGKFIWVPRSNGNLSLKWSN